MPGLFQISGAQSGKQTRFAPIWTGEFATGLFTNRSPFRDGLSPRILAKYYGANSDAMTEDSLNVEISTRLTPVRRPGLSVYNTQTFDSPNSFYEFRQFKSQNSETTELIKVMVDTDDTIFDGTGPSNKINIWNKATGSGQSYFQSVADILFFGDSVEQKKYIQSQLDWQPSTIYSASSTDGTLGDFIVDSNMNLQVAVGGFTVLIDTVQVLNDVLTLTLNTANLPDPTGAPFEIGNSPVGGTLPAGNWYARICGVDSFGSTTEAGSESLPSVTTGTTSSLAWSWTPISGAASYRIYIGTTSGGESGYFTTTVPSFGFNSTSGMTIGAPPSINTTVVDVPNNLYRMLGVQLNLSQFVNASFLNGQTITILSVLPGGQESTQITAALTSVDYGPSSDTGVATSGTGITGSTEPTWQTQLNVVTQDGGAQWINRGYDVENWGLAAPLTAPDVFQTPAPVSSIYPSWQPNTTYWPSSFIQVNLSGTESLFQLTTSGVTGTSYPAFSTATIGTTTDDGTAVWTYQGTGAWIANHAYTKGIYVLGAGTTSRSIFISLNAGQSGSSQVGWTNPVAGSIQQDNQIQWKCLGYVMAYPADEGGGFRTPFGPSTSVSCQTTILDTNGYLQQIQDSPLNGGGSGATAIATGTISGPNFTVTGVTVTNGGSGYTQDKVLVQIGVTAGAGSEPTLGPACGVASVVNGVIVSVSLISQGLYALPFDPTTTVIITPLNTPWVSGSSQPTWATPNNQTTEILMQPLNAGEISPSGLSSNIGKVFSSDILPFFPGQQAVVSGFTTLTYLNGTWTIVPIATADDGFPYLPKLGFAFQIAHATQSLTSDTGLVVVTQNGMWLNIAPYAPAGTAPKLYGYAYKNSIDDTISNMSPVSSPITATAGNFITSVGLGSPDLQCDTVVIYATDQGGDTFFQLDLIDNPGPGIQWQYTDTLSDAGLNILIEAATDFQNSPPPQGIINLAYHLNRIFGSVGNTVYWSTGPDTPTGNGLNGFSPSNYAIMPSLVKRIVPLSTGVLVFTVSDIYLIYGSATTSSPLLPYPYTKGVGLSSYNALDINGGIIYFFSSDAQLLSLDPNNGLTEVGFPVGDQLESALFAPSTAYVTWHVSGSRDKSMFVADGIGNWFRMNPTPAPETGVTWNPKATITNGCKCVQSVETSPGVHQLLVGSLGTGQILYRDLSTNADNGTAYPAYFTVGSLVLAHPGQIAELSFLTTDSIATGKPLVPSVLIDEISGVFENMPRGVPDPPQLEPSKSLYSTRYYFAQTGRPALCRHMQLKFEWAVEDTPNELLACSLFGGFLQER